MSATSVPTRERASFVSPVTLPRVIRSEWTKLRSLRSTRWTLLVACLFMAALGPLIALVQMAQWNHLGAAQRLSIDPIDIGIGGYHLAQLAIGVLGVMVITGEYSTGSIRSTFMAVPRRLPVLWAKIIVFSSVALVLMLITALIGFLLSQAIYTQHHLNVGLGHAPALRVLIGAVLYMTVSGIFCIALGSIIRVTAGAISAYVAIMFVIPPLTLLLPDSIQNPIHRWLPSSAGGGVAQVARDAHTFAPWTGFAVFCGYTIVLVAIAAYLLRKRDA